MYQSLNLFASAGEQIANLMCWNRDYSLGLPVEQVNSLSVPSPDADEGWVVPVLTWSLGDTCSTASAAWRIAADQHRDAWSFKEFPFDSECLRLLRGTNFTPFSVSWEVINLRANYECIPREVRSSSSGHAQLLIAAAHFTEWSRQLGATPAAPSVVLAGYESRLPQHRWDHDTMFLSCDENDRLILNRTPIDRAYRATVIPEVLSSR